MAKHIPTAEFNEVLTRGDAVGTLKEIGAKRSNVFDLDIEQIAVLPDFNPRVSGTKDYEAHIDALAASIITNGFLPGKPLSVFPAEEAVEDSDEKVTVFYVVDGHSRLEAAKRAIAKGAKIETLPVSIVPRSENVLADLAVLTVLNNNSTRPLSSPELAIVVKRLTTYEVSKADIASKLGITVRYVDDLLVLHGAQAAVQEAVRSGSVSATLAIAELRQHGEKAGARIQAAVEKAKAAGKPKVTPKQMPKTAPTKAAGKATAKAKIEKAAKAAKPVKGHTRNKVQAPVEGAVATDADFLRGAIEYALAMPKKGGEGMAWLAKIMAEDAVALGELESWLGQPKGAFFDTTLRGPVDKDGI